MQELLDASGNLLPERGREGMRMRMLKKQVLKEDGRYLVYYHSPETATPEQAAAFASVEAEAETVSAPENSVSLSPNSPLSDTPREARGV
jgi:hypothetical protein